MTEHIYIHWPFCRSKCWYCDFASFTHNDKIEDYHKALCKEIEQSDVKYDVKTIFFGGGTPSLYPLHLLEELFDVIQKKFSLENIQESTIEVNPETITEEHLKVWRSLGINRLSVGVQILNEKILKSVNRHQSDVSVTRLLDTAPKYFDNISVDLILGLPGTTTKIWFDTLEYLISQEIKHVSVYFLTLYEKTPLAKKIKNQKIEAPDDEWLIKNYEKTLDFLEQNNFFQYEISNFAKRGFESIHNKAYWDRKRYRGFGLSAASFDGKKRLVNSDNLLDYINRSGISEESLTIKDEILEELMLGLRQKKGLDLQRVIYFLGETTIAEERISQLDKLGLIKEKNGRIVLTTRGMVLENEIILSLVFT